MKKALVVLLALMMVFGLAACGNSNSGGGEDEENIVVVYTSSNQEILDLLEPAFEEATGIDAQFVSFASAEGFAKAQAEREDPQADVMSCGGWAEIHSDPDLFEPYQGAHYDEYDPAVVDPSFLSHSNSGNTSVLIYNTDLCPIEIKGYADLLDPALKGHIAMGNAIKSNSAYYHLENMLLAMGSDPENQGVDTEQGWDYVEKFLNNLDGKIVDSSSAVYKGVASGEYWVGLTYDVGALTIINDGATNVKAVCMEEGVVTKTGGPGIIKNCKHPEQAKAYIDFITSKEWAEIAVTVPGQMTLRTDVEIPEYNDIGLSTAKILDCNSTWTSEHKEEIVAKYQALLEEINFGS